MPGMIWNDLLLAWRSIRHNPGFAVINVAVLAVGIGAVTVMISTLYGVVLRPLPFTEPERLIWVWSLTDRGSNNTVAAVDYYDYRDQCRSFESLAAHLAWQQGALLSGGDEPQRVLSTKVSGNLFSTLGETPLLGRSFVTEEEVSGGPRAVVVSYGLWQSRLDGDPEVVGRKMTIDGAPFEVVGVMGESFDYPQGTDLWQPMQRGGQTESGRGNNNFWVIGRLKEGMSLAQAQSEIDAVAAHIAASYPEAKKGWGASLQPMQEVFFGDLRQPMLLLTGATLLLLLIACANLSSLLLAKVISRRGELAVRRALGASPWGINRQVMVESSVLACLGAATGLGVAAAGIRMLKLLGPSELPRLQTIGLDLPVILAVMLATALTGILVGIIPALQSSRGDLARQLTGARSTTGSGRGLRVRGLLVSAQTALCMVLLVSSGLLIRSSLHLQQVDPGFDPQQLLTLRIHLPVHQYPSGGEKSGSFIAELLEKLRGHQNVAGAAVADQLPPFGGAWNGIYRADRPPKSFADRLPATRRFVSEGYFQTLGTPMLAGRDLDAADRLGDRPVMVISRMLAETMFPGEDPLGQLIVYDSVPHEIVGVGGDVKDFGLAADGRPAFYLPMRQYPSSSFKLVLRSHGKDPAALTAMVRRVVSEMERDAAITGAGTMTGWLSESLAGAHFTSFLLVSFSAIALLLAAIGLFGVMAFLIAARTREIGIRIAMGAQPYHVVSWVLGKGMLMAGSGIVLGLLVSLLTSRLLESMLFATTPTDLLTYVVVSATLLAVILAACLIPARRALRLDLRSVITSE